MKGKTKGRGNQGRRRTSWLKTLRDWFGRISNQLFRAVSNKANPHDDLQPSIEEGTVRKI